MKNEHHNNAACHIRGTNTAAVGTCSRSRTNPHWAPHELLPESMPQIHKLKTIMLTWCPIFQEEDVTVLAAPESDPEWMLGAQITDDGRSGHHNIVAHQHTLCTVAPVSCCDAAGHDAAGHGCGM